MAPAGTRRARKAVASDSEESDASRDSPRPQKLRKRLSEAHAEPGATHQSQQDSSFTVENGQQRVPLKSVNMNEDDAEKRRRRKSAKHALEAAGAGPSSEGNDPDASRSMAGRRQQPLNAVSAEREPAAVPKLSKDVMNSNFEEWMKMATDNVRWITRRCPAAITHVYALADVENQCYQLLGLRPYRLFPRHVPPSQ